MRTAGSLVPRAGTEPSGPGAGTRRPARAGAFDLLRAVVLEGAAAVVLTLIFFAGFLALLAFVFPVGQDLRALLQSDREAAQRNRLLARTESQSARGALGEFLASLRVVRPVVRRRLAGTIAWAPAPTGVQCRSGDGIQTGSEGRALVNFENAQIRLEANSLVILGTEAQSASGLPGWTAPARGLMVLQGEVAARLTGGAEGLTLALPNAVAAIRASEGTTGQVVVSVDRDHSSIVTAVEGSVGLESNGRTLALGPRQFTRVGKDGELGEPLPIPAAPVLEAPPTGTTYPFLDLPPKVQFGWRTVDGPGEWRVMVARDAGFEDVVVDERVQTNSLQWGRFEPGRYHWQVVRLLHGVPSPPSRSRTLEVSRRNVPLTLQVEPPPARVDGLRCVIRGTAVPGATVYVKGEPATVASDGSFKAEIHLEPGANIVLVEAVAAGGQNVHSSHVIHARP